MARVRQLLASAPREMALPADEPLLRLDEEGEESCRVEPIEPGVWWVSGARIEKAAAMTNWDYHESQERFQRIMSALGVSGALKAAGAVSGDVILFATRLHT